MYKEVIIIGASGHGKVIADIVRKSGDKVFGFLDDDSSKPNLIGRISDCYKYKDKYFIVGIGNNEVRKNIATKYSDLNYYTAIHPTAVIADNVMIGAGTALMANVVINVDAKVGRHCIINTSSVIEHENLIGNYAHISPNATLCGTVSIGESTHIGAGTVVRNNISIGSNITVGCGSVVVGNLIGAGTYVGVPAKELK